MRLGVLGGTFDPVHIGHLLLGEAAREELALERVLFVPAGRPWRKTGREITPGEQRLEMLRLAVEDNPAFEVVDLELQRAGPSYTAETLAELRGRYRDAELHLILGEDALADLPNWRDPDRILDMATLVVARRPGVERCGEPPPATRQVWLSMPPMPVSASDIRDRARNGHSIRYMVPPAVAAYIRDRRLYTK